MKLSPNPVQMNRSEVKEAGIKENRSNVENKQKIPQVHNDSKREKLMMITIPINPTVPVTRRNQKKNLSYG